MPNATSATTFDPSNYIFFLKNFLSNFHTCNFIGNGVKFTNTEQYFMYQKALTFGDAEIAEAILATKEPYVAKRLGRNVKNYDDRVWAKKRYQVFLDANLLKYTQNPDLAKKLLETGHKILVECNPNDTIWGIGLSIEEAKVTSPDNWQGKNLLGLVLMDVRSQLAGNTSTTNFNV